MVIKIENAMESLLKQAGMNQRSLAKAIGVREQTVSEWGGKWPQYAIAYLQEKVRADVSESRLKACQERQDQVWKVMGIPKQIDWSVKEGMI